MGVLVDFVDNEYERVDEDDGMSLVPDNPDIIQITNGTQVLAYVPVARVDIVKIEKSDDDASP